MRFSQLWRHVLGRSSRAAPAETEYRLGVELQDRHLLADAEQRYRKAIALDPAHIRAYNNLGAVLQMQEKFGDALACYRRAVELEPAFDQPYLNLGRLQESMGDKAGAAASFSLAIARGIETDTFRHLLDAVEGVTTARAPAGYARNVFDHFARDFDARLNDLEYRIPQILCTRVCAQLPAGSLRVLDLGCGTGFCAAHIRARAQYLTGVDLSPGMLAKAREHGLYDRLVEGDIVEFLASAPASSFEAAVAADVFIYLGDLQDVFHGVARALVRGGIFAFSTEVVDGDGRDFVLRPSGHYAQSPGYIERLAGEAGFSVKEAFAQTIRCGRGHEVEGKVFVVSKS